MVDTLEELTADTLSLEYVERRLDDWVRRIDGLFAQIIAWSAPGWTAVAPRRTVPMKEAPMREVGLGPIDVPVLDLSKDGRPTVTIEPRSLWIIGWNGRLDVSGRGQGAAKHMLVDTAHNFEPPEWCVVSMEDRTTRVRLDKTILLSIL